jgi:hypothetical protein
MTFAIGTEPALARTYLNCLTKKVVIVDAPRGGASSSVEEKLGFWIDEATKTLVLADGPPLTVRLCVLKTRFGNSGDEGRRGRAQIRCGPRAGWRDGSERLC